MAGPLIGVLDGIVVDGFASGGALSGGVSSSSQQKAGKAMYDILKFVGLTMYASGTHSLRLASDFFSDDDKDSDINIDSTNKVTLLDTLKTTNEKTVSKLDEASSNLVKSNIANSLASAYHSSAIEEQNVILRELVNYLKSSENNGLVNTNKALEAISNSIADNRVDLTALSNSIVKSKLDLNPLIKVLKNGDISKEQLKTLSSIAVSLDNISQKDANDNTYLPIVKAIEKIQTTDLTALTNAIKRKNVVINNNVKAETDIKPISDILYDIYQQNGEQFRQTKRNRDKAFELDDARTVYYKYLVEPFMNFHGSDYAPMEAIANAYHGISEYYSYMSNSVSGNVSPQEAEYQKNIELSKGFPILNDFVSTAGEVSALQKEDLEYRKRRTADGILSPREAEHEKDLGIVDDLEYRKKVKDLKDLEGNVIAKTSVRNVEAIKNASKARAITDEINFELDNEDFDLLDFNPNWLQKLNIKKTNLDMLNEIN